MKFSKDRQIDGKVKELVREGWNVFRGGRHYRLQHPTSGFTTTVPGTPGDRRTVQNWFSQFRRAERVGFDPKIIFHQGGQ